MNEQSTTCELAQEPSTWKMAGWLILLLACIYLLSGSKLYFGYEGWNVAQAEAMAAGGLSHRPDGRMEPWAKGGIIEVLIYLPGAVVKQMLAERGALSGLRQLIHIPVQPLIGVMIALAQFFLALELFGRRRTALGVALIGALATIQWPYAKHGMEQLQTFWLLVGLIGVVRYNRRGCMGGALTMGVAMAMVMLTKVTGLFMVGMLAATAGWLCWSNRWLQRPGAAGHAGLVAGIALAGLFVLLATNRWRFGYWSLLEGRYEVGVETEGNAPLLWMIWAALASPNKSLLLYSPPLIVAAWWALAFLRRFRGLWVFWLLCAVQAVYYIQMYTTWDETWGLRRLHWLIPLTVLPLGCWLEALPDLRPWVRRLGCACVGLGVGVQLLAVAFDYTEHAKALGFRDIYYIQNNVWDPQFSPTDFHLLLLRSNMRRNLGDGESLSWRWEPRYIVATSAEDPAQQIPSREIPLAGHDRLDLWYLQQARDFDGAYWGRSPSSWGVPLLIVGALAGGILLRRRWKLENAQPTPDN